MDCLGGFSARRTAHGKAVRGSAARVPHITSTLMNLLSLRHVRLGISAIVGLSSYLAMPDGWERLTRVLIAWNTFSVLFLILVGYG